MPDLYSVAQDPHRIAALVYIKHQELYSLETGRPTGCLAGIPYVERAELGTCEPFLMVVSRVPVEGRGVRSTTEMRGVFRALAESKWGNLYSGFSTGRYGIPDYSTSIGAVVSPTGGVVWYWREEIVW